MNDERVWDRWRSLSASERRFVIRAVMLLPLVRGALRLAVLDRAVSMFNGRPVRAGSALTTHQARTMAGAFEAASRRLPLRFSCLERALAATCALRARGVAACTRIGVRKEGQMFAAHAWVELDAQPLTDAQDIASRYPPFEPWPARTDFLA
jgi:hypothetical protein